MNKKTHSRKFTARPSAQLGAYFAGLMLTFSLLPVAPLSAADLYYDVDPATAPIDGGTANWSDANWKAEAGSTSGSSWAANDSAIFDAIVGSPSATTITLGGTETATAVTFNAAGYTLTGGTLSLAGTGGGNWITMNADGTIASALSVMRFKGSAEATVSGGGALGGNRIVLGDGGGTTVTVRQTGGAITTSDYMMVGGNNVAGSQGSYIIDGGSLLVSQGAYLGWGHASSAGTITQNGGTVTIGGQGLQLGIGGGSGAYVLNGGTLDSFFGNDSAAGSFTFGGGTFKAATGFTADLPRLASSTIASNATAIIDTAGQTVTWNTPLTGALAAGLTKSGEGVLELAGTNSYAGGTTVERGTLVLLNANAIGNTTETLTVTRTDDLSFLFNKTSLDLRGISLSNTIVFTERNPGVGDAGALQNTAAGSTSVLSGAVTFAGDNYGGGDGNIRFDGVVSGGGSISGYTMYKQGGGTWTFANENNTFSGFYYQIGGTTEVTKLANLNEASSLGQPGTTTANQVRFGFGGSGGGRILFTGSSASVSDRAFILQGTKTAENNRIDASGTDAAATITLNGNLTAGSGYTLALGGTNAGINTYAGTLGNGTDLALLKDGSTTWRLTGTNTYTGATTVSAGRLVVDGSIASSAVTVNSGGTLAGSGTVGGLIVNSGGTISPGNSPGNLTVAGNLQWIGGGNYNWQVVGTTNTSGATAGTTWDLITVTGTLDLTALTTSSKFNINLWSLATTSPDTNGNIANFNPATSYKWLAVAAGTISNFNADNFNVNYLAANGTGGFSNPLAPGATFSVSQEGNNLYVTYGQAAPIPEPGTWAAMAIFAGGAAYAGWRRRQRATLS